MSTTRWIIGYVLLGATLGFGAYGVITEAAERASSGDIRYVRDSVYTEECGACHLAYPPGLLPAAGWKQVMAGLEDHFDESAELDAETTEHVGKYLATHALRPGQPSPMSQLLRNLPDVPPMRITELPAFLTAHELVARQLQLDEFSYGFLSPCADCHRQAGDGIFDKDRLHPGYGPPTWSDD
jgi:hypothetical protein